MAITVEAVFAGGAFRPLQPVTIPEYRQVRIWFDEPTTGLPSGDYLEKPLESPDLAADYQSVPPKAVRPVWANVTAGGRLARAPYPDE